MTSASIPATWAQSVRWSRFQGQWSFIFSHNAGSRTSNGATAAAKKWLLSLKIVLPKQANFCSSLEKRTLVLQNGMIHHWNLVTSGNRCAADQSLHTCLHNHHSPHSLCLLPFFVCVCEFHLCNARACRVIELISGDWLHGWRFISQEKICLLFRERERVFVWLWLHGQSQQECFLFLSHQGKQRQHALYLVFGGLHFFLGSHILAQRACPVQCSPLGDWVLDGSQGSRRVAMQLLDGKYELFLPV